MTESLKEFSKKLQALPTTVAIKIAADAAPGLTAAAKATFNAGEDAYGVTWAPGVDGQKIDLKDTGALAKGVVYVAIGTKIRAAFSVPYAKYQLGKRPALPRQGSALPASYVDVLTASTEKIISQEMAR